jgi:queuine/archaeosine tRNA-ribosyltransferase
MKNGWLMMENNAIYFPSISVGACVGGFEKNLKHHTGKSFRFYNKDMDPIYNYPYFLISAGHNYKKDIKEKIGVDPKNAIILGDSGGFQIATNQIKDTNDTRLKIFNWLEKNTNYSINLDIPLFEFKDGKRIESNNWDKNLIRSKENFQFFKDNASGSTKYLNVMHGNNIEKLDQWYNEMKDFNFDGGWAIGSSSSIFFMLLSFFYLLEHKEFDKFKNSKHKVLMHFLGFSKMSEVPLILYLQQKLNSLGYNITITYDSSSPNLITSFGKYILYPKNTGFDFMVISNNLIKEKKIDTIKGDLPCSCPVCKNMTFTDLLSMSSEKGFNYNFYTHVTLHNVYQYIKGFKIVEKVIKSDSYDIYKGVFNNKILNLLSTIDECFNAKEPTKVWLKNRNYILSNTEVDKITTDNSTLF